MIDRGFKKTKGCTIGDFKMLYNEDYLNVGCAYVRAFDILYGFASKACNDMDDSYVQDVSIKELDVSVSIPAIVIGAFACELYLKSLIRDLENTLKKHRKKAHSISWLFGKLDKEERKQIISYTIDNMSELFFDYDEECFDKDLNLLDNCFVQWRYFFEPNMDLSEGNFLFCRSFAWSLFTFARQ